ncbi:unnamed protein product [Dracunculus medinensis]|uniref:BAR domain-containing protein n=1 Tax=Dracunculus medinensis TaxID=318479 RepID=A0A0N4ULA3_DRAME|nr:unnamed protein product [Dracunculus medinensis]
MKIDLESRQKLDDPISTLDFKCEEFKKGVESIRDLLGIAYHPDSITILKACCKFIAKNLSNEAIQRNNIKAKSNPNLNVMPLNAFEIGMAESKDKQVNTAARALRLVHLENLREVQTEVNEAIVAVQKLTADPKTDARLGRVGF